MLHFKLIAFYALAAIHSSAIAAPSTPILASPFNTQRLYSSAVNFQWQANSATNYRIVISKYSDFRGFTDNISTNSFYCDSNCYTTSIASPSYTHNFSGNGLYYWKVRANNSNTSQSSSWSESFVLYIDPSVTPPTIPTTPILISPSNASTIGKDNVNYQWQSSNATSYRILISQYGNFGGYNESNSTCDGTCFTATTTSSMYAKSMSYSGQRYYWKVRANNSNSSIATEWSSASTFTTTGSPSTIAPPETLQAYANGLIGKKVDFDLQYGNQCVDLMRVYVRDYLKISNQYSYIPRGRDGVGAKYIFYTTTTSSKFKKILKSSGEIPQPGDIVFWDWYQYGHVAIVLSANSNGFTSLEQNSTGDLDPVTKKFRGYNNVIGWLRHTP